MEKALALVALLFVLCPVMGAGPAKYLEYEVYLDVQENNRVYETVNLTFPEVVDSFNYYLLHPAGNLTILSEGLAIDCTAKRVSPGMEISCENISVSSIQLYYEFAGLVKQNGPFYVVSDQYVFSTPTDEFYIRIMLPEGYVVSDEGFLEQESESYNPTDAIQGTDGRRISLTWKREPKIGEIFSFYVSYENVSETRDYSALMFFLIGLAVLLVVMQYLRRKPTLKEYGLNEDERKVLDVLLKENRISQKKIARETGFSKAHVSRIAKNLESRGLIERKRIGRTYEVVLKV
ncbi:MAG: MarR family transcriptional regulator [Candidatus Aenigmarchaeota archaeon]|nr:MarR family transcriptional regulator [Candidatus Aenigmarchaeota archaeon]